MVDLIKSQSYWPKGVPSDSIDTNFENKEVVAVVMIEARTEDNKLVNYFWKDPDYVTKIMASWMTLDELVGARTRRYFIDSIGTKETKQLKYWQPFGVHFRYRHQVDDQNNRRHVPIFLERTWGTRFWLDCNFAWYLAVLEINTAPASGHFQNDGVKQPSLDIWKYLAIYCIGNTIGVEFRDNGRPKITSKLPVYVPCKKFTVKHHCGMWH